MGLIDDVGRGPVALDTAAFIYFIEEHPIYVPIVAPLFEAIDAGKLEASTSAITLLEVLVLPYRSGDADLAVRYERLLTRSRGLTMVALDNALLGAAAQLRAAARVKKPDAIQLAAALHRRATSFVTNDRELSNIGSLRILQLSHYV